MHFFFFFVAKVNLGRNGGPPAIAFLRPLQVRLRDQEIHAAAASRHRQRPTGPQDLVVLALTAQRTRRDHELLPHGEAAHPAWTCRSTSRTSSAKFYTAMFGPRRRARGPACPSSSNTPGIWHRAIRARPSRWRRPSCRRLGARLGRAAAASSRASTCATTPRIFPEDLSFMENPAKPRANFPGPLCAAPSVARRGELQRRRALFRPRLSPRFRAPRGRQTLADLTGWSAERIGARMSQTGQNHRRAGIGPPAISSTRMLRGGPAKRRRWSCRRCAMSARSTPVLNSRSLARGQMLEHVLEIAGDGDFRSRGKASWPRSIQKPAAPRL